MWVGGWWESPLQHIVDSSTVCFYSSFCYFSHHWIGGRKRKLYVNLQSPGKKNSERQQSKFWESRDCVDFERGNEEKTLSISNSHATLRSLFYFQIQFGWKLALYAILTTNKLSKRKIAPLSAFNFVEGDKTFFLLLNFLINVSKYLKVPCDGTVSEAI